MEAVVVLAATVVVLAVSSIVRHAAYRRHARRLQAQFDEAMALVERWKAIAGRWENTANEWKDAADKWKQVSGRFERIANEALLGRSAETPTAPKERA